MFVKLASTKSMFVIAVGRVLSLLWQRKLKFPLAYNGKRKNWPLSLSHCRYIDKKFYRYVFFFFFSFFFFFFLIRLT